MMARLTSRQSTAYPSSAAHRPVAYNRAGSEILAASSPLDSDKENAGGRVGRSSLGKRKTTPGSMSTPQPTSTASKKRRVEERQNPVRSQTSGRHDTNDKTDKDFYDPEQDEATKRDTTKRLRELNSNLNDSRSEFLQRASRGIQDTITEADSLYRDVKQTSTAAIDSRLLVSVGDLAYKKINTLTVGDSSTSIDVDDFLSKCIAYMRKSPDTGNALPTLSQRRRRQRQATNNGSDEEDEEDAGELDFSYLGRTLCFPANNRPCLSSFLLGPLSVQKKVRQQSQRKATQRTQNLGEARRPIQLDEEDLDKQESASLTVICSEISQLLRRSQERGQQQAVQDIEDLEQELGREPSQKESKAIMRKYNIADNGNVPLFNFCVNPKSFGQSVENFFYVSFLIKEGKVGLDFDDDGMPTLGMVEQKTVEERQDNVRNQAVFTLDFDIWEELVESCGIRRSIIPHRKAEEWEDDDGVIRPGAVLAEMRNNHVQDEGTMQVVEDEELYAAN